MQTTDVKHANHTLTVRRREIDLVLAENGAEKLSVKLAPIEDIREIRSLQNANFSIAESHTLSEENYRAQFRAELESQATKLGK